MLLPVVLGVRHRGLIVVIAFPSEGQGEIKCKKESRPHEGSGKVNFGPRLIASSVAEAPKETLDLELIDGRRKVDEIAMK